MDKSEMLLLKLDGQSYRAIAEQAGLSKQRVYQLLAPPKAIRIMVVSKYEGRCANCHIHVGKSGHVHHVGTANFDDYNEIDNLRLLCPSCHRLSHTGGVKAENTRRKLIEMPPPLAEQIKLRADESGQSQNALIIQILEERRTTKEG